MKKLFLLFLILFSTPVLALITENIPNSCGNIIFAHAVFTPNLININWYENSTSTSPMIVPSAAEQCTYDQPITVPSTNPTKPGYTFVGWTLRQPQNNNANN